MHREPTKPPPRPKCESCLQPADCFDAWGRQLCADCTDAWLASPERKAATAALYPMPAWQVARAKAAGEPVPELPTDAQLDAAYRHGVGLWLERRKSERALRVAR